LTNNIINLKLGYYTLTSDRILRFAEIKI